METAKRVQQGAAKKKLPDRSKRYGSDFKLQVVKKYLEESVPVSIIAEECRVSKGSIGRWVRAYRRYGEAGLSMSQPRKGRSLPSAVRQKIIELKESSPLFGVKRISQVLKRMFFLSASPETVRKTLHSKSLMAAPQKKRQRNITRPRFFERATPNQLWQTDIFTFRLGVLIGVQN
jgi:transposase